MARRQAKEAEEGSTQADLLPVMNVMFLLIPALLMAMEFAQMAAITVIPPSHAAGAPSEPPPAREGLDLAVMIGRDGIEVRAAGAPVGERIPRAPEGAAEPYDFTALVRAIEPLKALHPEDGTVHVWAEGDVELQALVSTLDALRGPECSLARGEGCLFWRPVLRSS